MNTFTIEVPGPDDWRIVDSTTDAEKAEELAEKHAGPHDAGWLIVQAGNLCIWVRKDAGVRITERRGK